MKRILIACLIGIGIFMPFNEIKSHALISHRIVNVTIEGWVLFATSGEGEGEIKQIDIYDLQTMKLVKSEIFHSDFCMMSFLGLGRGQYVADVYTETNMHSKQFIIR